MSGLEDYTICCAAVRIWVSVSTTTAPALDPGDPAAVVVPSVHHDEVRTIFKGDVRSWLVFCPWPK